MKNVGSFCKFYMCVLNDRLMKISLFILHEKNYIYIYHCAQIAPTLSFFLLFSILV